MSTLFQNLKENIVRTILPQNTVQTFADMKQLSIVIAILQTGK